MVAFFVCIPQYLKLLYENLKFIQGDVLNYLLVAESVKDKSAVISALGASNPFKYDQAVVDGVSNIIRAMELNGVGRFIYMSFVGVKETRDTAGFVIRHIAPKILSSEIEGHETRENMIRKSNIKWTIVRAPTLTNGKHLASFRSGEKITSKGFTVKISRADVADFMLQQISNDKFLRKAPTVMY